MNENFCGFKTAYLINSGDIPELESLEWSICESDRSDLEIFRVMRGVKFPKGWTWRGTDISGAGGFVLEFDIDKLPTAAEMDEVEAVLIKLGRKTAKRFKQEEARQAEEARLAEEECRIYNEQHAKGVPVAGCTCHGCQKTRGMV